MALTCACHILLALSLTLIPAAPLLCSGHTCPHSANEHTCSPSLQSSPGITFTSSTLAPPPPGQAALCNTRLFNAFCLVVFLLVSLRFASLVLNLVFQTGSHVYSIPTLQGATSRQGHSYSSIVGPKLQTQLIKVNQVQWIRSLK